MASKDTSDLKLELELLELEEAESQEAVSTPQAPSIAERVSGLVQGVPRPPISPSEVGDVRERALRGITAPGRAFTDIEAGAGKAKRLATDPADRLAERIITQEKPPGIPSFPIPFTDKRIDPSEIGRAALGGAVQLAPQLLIPTPAEAVSAVPFLGAPGRVFGSGIKRGVGRGARKFFGKSVFPGKGKPEVAPKVEESALPVTKEAVPPPTPTVPTPIKVAPESQRILKTEEGFAGNIKLNKFEPEVQEGIKKLVEKKPGIASRPVISDEKLRKIADDLKGTPVFDKIFESQEGQLAAEALSLRKGESSAIKTLLSQDLGDFGKSLAEFMSTRETTKVSRAAYEVGRGLGQFKLTADEQAGLTKLFLDKIKQIEKDPILAKQGKEAFVKQLEELKGKVLDKEFNPTAFDKIYEFWLNAILSSPKTHFVNTFSNATFVALKPIQKFFAASADLPISVITGKRTQFFSEIPAQMKGLFRAFKRGNKFDVAKGAKFEERPGAIGGRKGDLIRIPTTGLQVEDNFFKRIIGLMETFGQARARGAKRGLTGKALERSTAKLIQEKGGKVIPSRAISRKVENEELIRTFQNELGTIGNWFLKGRRSIPGARYIVPFLRTPVNIFKRVVEVTPFESINIARKGFKALKGTGKFTQEELANDIGNLTLGSMIATATAYGVMNGFITGEPPRNAKDRAQFYLEGKKPGSLKIGNKWIPIARFEPIGTSVGAIANIVQDFSDKDEELPQDKVISAISGISKNLTNKSFLSGMTNFVQAISDPERFGDKFFGRIPAGFAGGIGRFITQQEETIRRPKTFTEQIKTVIPGLAKQVPAIVDPFGQEVKRPSNFFERFLNIGTISEDPVVKELERLEYSLPLAPTRLLNRKLTSEEGNNFQKEAGQIIHSRLKSRISKGNYKDKSNEAKISMIEKIVSNARKKARNTLRRKEFENRKRGLPITQ